MARRFPAEWEPQSAVQLTWPHQNTDWADVLHETESVFVAIAEAITRFQKLLVVCQSRAVVEAQLQHCPPERLILVEAPSDDTWARDHGGITVFENETPILLDFQFNGWGSKYRHHLDNQLTSILWNQGVFQADVQYQPVPFVLEGGALESDGKGTLLTTRYCLLNENRNHWQELQAEEHLKSTLGVERILWLDIPPLLGDDTDGHIDTLARFVSPNKIVFAYTENHQNPNYSTLQTMYEQLKTFQTTEGHPYQLVALPSPVVRQGAEVLPATYANFLVINHAVLVPLYNIPEDTEALQTLAQCFPTKEIIGINCRTIISQNGSLHCLTMQYPHFTI